MTDNLQTIQNFQDAAWGDKDISAIENYFHEDVTVHSPVKETQGTARLKEVFQHWYTAFPNLTVHWDDFICENDQVVCRWNAEGTHTGDFSGIAPTNKNIHYTGVTIYKLAHEKVTEYWAFVDMDHIKQQLL